jgi:CRP/FNR family transcriptional regulator, dissimilatory nitrate respiration regulator
MPANALRKCKLFHDLDATVIQRLLEAAQPITVPRGEAVFRKGQPCEGLYVLQSGQIKLCTHTQQGEEHLVELLAAGDTLAELALVMQRPHGAAAIAVTPCSLLLLPRRAVLAELGRDHQFALNLVQTLAEQVHARANDLENLLFRKAEGRVARFLMDTWVPGSRLGNVVRLPARKGLIASRLHMTKEHFSRTLRELSERGVVAVRHLDIEILDMPALERLAA